MQRTLALIVVAFAFLPAADAHALYEASELEVHALNDEGSDLVEAYGGFDIQDLFIGPAHDESLGVGGQGDGFYFRIELYGLPENGVGLPGAVWSVHLFADTPSGPLERTLSTTDGNTFTSDFDALVTETDPAERSVHVQRAFVRFAKASLLPGDALSNVRLESRVDGDLRDIAPGGIPFPGTNGALSYEDPGAIEGKGRLADAVVLRPVSDYVTVAARPASDGFTVTVATALKAGGQHVYLTPRPADGWIYEVNGTASGSLSPNGTLEFRLVIAERGVAPLVLDVQTDLGGRAELLVEPAGTLILPDGSTVVPSRISPDEKAPGAAIGVAGLCLLGLALLRRR